ncbi:hypothetical protein D7X33_22250 [Butyricicoccus sp. 1XD8-22]|nr:hypothetical protein D7X33_22250 [Butyricicoccus sp. 1XD8-22]
MKTINQFLKVNNNVSVTSFVNSYQSLFIKLNKKDREKLKLEALKHIESQLNKFNNNKIQYKNWSKAISSINYLSESLNKIA